MIYRKLKRTWSHNDLNYIPNFKKVFPELSKLNSEELCDRFSELKVDFYTEEKVAVPLWLRLTLPFALIVMLLMFILLPVNFLFTGKWYYEYLLIYNWFKSLKLS